MKCLASTVIKIAEDEVGYKEKASNSQLYDDDANVGYNNWNKYANDIDTKYPDFYNGKKNGYDWCDVFVDWCFIQAYGVDEAQRLLCQPDKSLGAGCEYSYGYYKNNGQVGSSPKLGAQIFFGDLDHTGIVVDFDEDNVWTVEGNTGSDVNEVCKKKYSRDSSWIYGYGYPKFDSEDEEPHPALASDVWTGKYPSLPSRGYYLTGDGYERFKNKQTDIKYIQEFMNWAIDSKLDIDGCYGPDTTKAVAEFQKIVGIEVDGSYGKDTLASAKAFNKKNAKKPAEPTFNKIYTVNSRSGLNVRDGAGMDCKILVAIPYGHRVESDGESVNKDGIKWLHIKTYFNGKNYIGFVSAQWLS